MSNDRSDGPATAIRVMVVDDHPMWREGVARDLTEAGFEVVGTAGDGAAAVRVATATRRTASSSSSREADLTR